MTYRTGRGMSPVALAGARKRPDAVRSGIPAMSPTKEDRRMQTASVPISPPIVNPCLHCGKTSSAWRRRGLCQRCFGCRPIRVEYAKKPNNWPGRVPSDSPRCVHCHVGAGCSSRLLCNRCYRDPAVRHRYPPLTPTQPKRRKRPIIIRPTYPPGECRWCGDWTEDPDGRCQVCIRIPDSFTDDDYNDRPPPATPTAAPAGSPGRISVYAARYARGQALFHPDDNPEVLIVAEVCRVA